MQNYYKCRKPGGTRLIEGFKSSGRVLHICSWTEMLGNWDIITILLIVETRV